MTDATSCFLTLKHVPFTAFGHPQRSSVDNLCGQLSQPVRRHQPLAGSGQLHAVSPITLTDLHKAFGRGAFDFAEQRLQHIGLPFVDAAEAYRTVRPIEVVKVWDVNIDRASSLVGSLNRSGISASLVKDLEAAVATSDIVSCATMSTTPIIRGKWLRAGTHLDLIGSVAPTMRESDDDCFRISSVFVDTEEAMLKAGDILEPVRNGAFSNVMVAGTLQELCQGAHDGRFYEGEITLFKAVGTALEDLAAASLAFDAC